MPVSGRQASHLVAPSAAPVPHPGPRTGVGTGGAGTGRARTQPFPAVSHTELVATVPMCPADDTGRHMSVLAGAHPGLGCFPFSEMDRRERARELTLLTGTRVFPAAAAAGGS